MSRALSRQAVKAIPRPFRLSTGTSRRMHSTELPYTGPPSYDTIIRRLSSDVDPRPISSASASKRLKIAVNLLTSTTSTSDPNEYDVLLTDVTHAKLQPSIAEELGITYLSKAADANEVVKSL